MPLELIITGSQDHMDSTVASFVRGDIKRKPRDQIYHLGGAAGESPKGAYELIAQGIEHPGNIHFWGVDDFFLSIGNTSYRERPESFQFNIHQNLVSKMKAPFGSVNFPNLEEANGELLKAILEDPRDDITILGKPDEGAGRAIIIDSDCKNTQLKNMQAIANEYMDRLPGPNGIDYWILGIGENGHVGFHEPGISFEAPYVFVVETSSSTRKKAQSYDYFKQHPDLVPNYGVTVGIRGIKDIAQRIIFLGNKPQAVYDALLNEKSEDLPLSFIQDYIRNSKKTATLVIDDKTHSMLKGSMHDIYKKGVRVSDYTKLK